MLRVDGDRTGAWLVVVHAKYMNFEWLAFEVAAGFEVPSKE